jgi:DNA-binding response OmpR family regulator
MKQTRILLVEDNKTLVQTIQKVLKDYDLTTSRTGQGGISFIDSYKFDLYIIDLMLPDRNGLNGLDICKYIRKKSTSPIIMITAKRAINYKLGAFSLGADDYICKPFNFLELRARIRALLKRTYQVPDQCGTKCEFMSRQHVCIDKDNLTVRI